MGREFPEREVQLQTPMGHRLLQQERQVSQPPRIPRNLLSGDRTIDRIKEGIEDESPSLSFINNLNLTYNLTKADKYVFNAIFRNNLSNAPYQNELNKMWAAGSTESIYSYVNNHTSSYSPALDLYFQHTLPHQQSIQVNVTGTLIHTKTTGNTRSTKTRTHRWRTSRH